MKRLFKKNQIIIATLAVMIAVAGYLNYSGRLFGETDDSTTEANADLANQVLLDISQEDIETQPKISQAMIRRLRELPVKRYLQTEAPRRQLLRQKLQGNR